MGQDTKLILEQALAAPLGALHLADRLSAKTRWHDLTDAECDGAAAELRRLHAEADRLRGAVEVLLRGMKQVQTRPAMESAFIAAVVLEDAKQQYGVTIF